MAVGLGIRQGAALKAKGGDDLLARPEFMLALARRRLNPREFLAGNVGQGGHGDSLSRPWLVGLGAAWQPAEGPKCHKWRIRNAGVRGNVIAWQVELTRH
jgi:hypothetical protein